MRAIRHASALLIATLLALAVPAAGAQEASPTLPDIEDEVMCPICGTSLELSEAPQAERQRAFIRARIEEGLGKQEIKDRLVDEYGEEVLAVPSTEGFDLAAWLVPGAALLLAAGALALGVRRWRHEGGGGSATPPPDRPDDQRRLEEELRRYGI